MNIDELKKEYAEQDNRATAYPTYVTVQELQFVGVIADDYSVSGDGIEKREHSCEGCKNYPCWNEESEEEPKHCDEDIQCGYMWIDVEPFLTIKGAEEYIKLNGHNLNKPRIYVKHFNNRNIEMNNLLKELGFKTNG